MRSVPIRVLALVCVVVLTAASPLIIQALPPQAIGSWSPAVAVPLAPTDAATATLPDGRTLLIGGIGTDGAPTSGVVFYDADANGFSAVGQLSSARTRHSASILGDGRVAVIGGLIEGAATGEIEIFDPATGVSAALATLSHARAGHASAVLPDGSVLVVGGVDADGVPLSDAEIYNAETNAVVAVPNSMSTARVGATATTLIDGRVLIAGGHNGTSDLATAEIYYAESQTFDPATTTLSVARSRHSAVLLPHNAGVLIAGGTTDGTAQKATDLFVPAIFPDPYSYGTGTFATTADLNEARAGASAGGTATDGYAFAVGGGVESAELYRFATVKTDKDDYAPGEPALITGTGWAPNSTVTLLFQEDPPVHPDYTRVNVPTDGDGNFSVNDWAPEEHDLNVRFYLTVSDGISRAQTTFTDGVITFTAFAFYPGGSTTGAPATGCTGSVGGTVATGTQICANASFVVSGNGGTPVSIRWRNPAGNVAAISARDPNFPNGATGPQTFAATFTPDVVGTWTALLCESSNDSGSTTGCQSAATQRGSATFQVIAGNAAPTLNAIGNKSVNELAPLTFTATATDSDVPANALTFSLDAGAPAGASITPSGAFTWTPTEAQGPGSYPVTVRVTDNGSPAANDFETITVTVTEVNLAPVLGAIGNKNVDEGTPLSFTATATDADLPPNTLTFSLVGGPAGASIDPSTGAFTWTPSEAQGPGTFTFEVRVTDSGSPVLFDNESITVTVNEVNAAPVLNTVGNKTGNELVALTFTASATDSDLPADTLTYSLTGAPAGASINASTGAFSWTPTEAEGPGSYTFTVRVTDNGTTPLHDEETITVTVNEVNVAPVLAAIGNQNVDEGVLLTFTTTATDNDVPANTLTFSLDAGAPAGATINATTGLFSWTPTEAQGPGVYPITVRVSDGGSPALFDSETITVTVREVNAAPVLAAIGNKEVNELETLAFSASAADSDLPANTLTFSLSGEPAGASINASTGAFSWAPTEAQGPESYTFTVRATDNGTPILHDEETITVTVKEVNVAPVLAPIENQNVDEGVLLTFTTTATDDDVPANTLTFSLDAGAPPGATINATTGVFSWTPTEAQGPGVYPITVRVTDNGSPAMSDFDTIDVTVKEVNLAPVLAAIGNQTVDEGLLLSLTATATDPDLPANTLTFTLDGGAPLGASISAAGAFTWTPSEEQGPGTYSVTVRVTDDGTPALDAAQAFSITVNEVNAAPVLATIGAKTVNEEVLLTFTATATDVDLPANTLTFSLVGAPAGAAITSGGVFTWTPSEAQGPGSYPVTIRVTDNGVPVESDEETITVTVNEVNVAPVLGAIGNKNVNELTPLAFTASATDVDLPANLLTFSLIGAPLGASINPTTGQFSWTPTEAQGPGAYMFAVRVTDNGVPNLFAEETITVTVAEVNLAPTLAPIGPKSVLLGNTLMFTASATDPDIPANALSFSLDAGAPAGASINSATGVFTWTPTAAQAGVHLITLRVSDNGVPSLSAAETITVTVQYSMCFLYDITKSHKRGSTIPIKLYLCDTFGNNVSSPGTVLNATAVVKVDPSASSAVVDDSGNANPDFNFRYDAGLGIGGGYIFNLSTKTAGYNTGTWKVVFTVNGVASTAAYFAPFDIR